MNPKGYVFALYDFQIYIDNEEKGSEEKLEPDHPETAEETTDFGLFNLFTFDSPKNFADGTFSGLKNLTFGTLVGIIAVLFLPLESLYSSYREKVSLAVAGISFFKSLALSLVVSILAPSAGLATFAFQFLRGTFNTPDSLIEEYFFDKEFKPEKRWFNYSIDDEEQELSDIEEDAFLKEPVERNTDGDGAQNVKDTKLYDVLNLAPNATQIEIKKHYYKLARKLHPDKNPEDEASKQKFQELASAFETLNDPKKREIYDVKGKQEENVEFDPNFVFSFLFGNELLKSLVGEFYYSMVAAALVNLDLESQGDQVFNVLFKSDERYNRYFDVKQRRRRLYLAKALFSTIDKDDEERYTSLESICSEEIGKVMIGFLGQIYMLASGFYEPGVGLGFLDQFFPEKLKTFFFMSFFLLKQKFLKVIFEFRLRFQYWISLFALIYKIIKILLENRFFRKETEDEESETKQLVVKLKTAVLSFVWRSVLWDVYSAVTDALRRVKKDKSSLDGPAPETIKAEIFKIGKVYREFGSFSFSTTPLVVTLIEEKLKGVFNDL
eukprot:augustus_masked-scaffold_8-processed-gene-12.3-mRNA-1 protein AED:0.05 eAED:0.06 QI:0/-1/0/1/-1/1/1/0/551